MKKLVFISAGICITLSCALTLLSSSLVKTYSCETQPGINVYSIDVILGLHYCNYEVSSTKGMGVNIHYRFVATCTLCSGVGPLASISSGWPLSYYYQTPGSSDTYISNSSLASPSTLYIASTRWSHFALDIIFWDTICSLVAVIPVSIMVHRHKLSTHHSFNDHKSRF
jgi:hypothetical protein